MSSPNAGAQSVTRWIIAQRAWSAGVFTRFSAALVCAVDGFLLHQASCLALFSGMGISMQQFQKMEARLSGAARSTRPVFEPTRRAAANGHEVILGLDPSLRGTGFGVIRVTKSHPRALTHGTISCPASWEHSRCLVKIVQTLRALLKEQKPTVCVVEGIFYAQNLQTALVMGEARGAALAVIAEAGLEIFEIAPRKVKQAIVGYGAAQKIAVAKMVQRMLDLAEMPAPDAADALALALAHAQGSQRYSLTPPKRV
jgi:crossover junction endodeoxyribonuclease RuvC